MWPFKKKKRLTWSESYKANWFKRYRRRIWLDLKAYLRIVRKELATFFWSILALIKDLFTFPFWCLNWYKDLIITLVVFLWNFFINLPANLKDMPRKIDRLIKYINKRFWDILFRQNEIRFILLKKRLFHISKIILLLYFLLSIIAEVPLHTDHEYAHLNRWWVLIYKEGLNWILIACLTYFLFWLISLYFIDLFYFIYTHQYNYGFLAPCLVDLCAPDILHESLFIFGMTFHYISYFIVSYTCLILNELEQTNKIWNPKYVTAESWRKDYLILKIKEETDNFKKELYIEEYNKLLEKNYDEKEYWSIW